MLGILPNSKSNQMSQAVAVASMRTKEKAKNTKRKEGGISWTGVYAAAFSRTTRFTRFSYSARSFLKRL